MPRSHIGVTTEVSIQSSPQNESVPSGRFQIVGITAKGPLNSPVIITSPNQYVQIFGERQAYDTLYDTMRTFFQEGGAELIVTRVVGPAATNGSVTLQDASETPVDVLTIEIQDPGAHSVNYKAVVTTNDDTTFTVSVVDNLTGRIIVTFPRSESPTDLVGQAMGNDYVTVRATGPAVNPKEGSYFFSAGSDDRAAITASRMIAALNAHKGIRPGVAVAIPGQLPSAIAADLAEHCKAKGKIGLLEVPAGLTESEAAGIGTALLNTANGEFVSMPFYPAIRVPDGADRTRTVGPVGYVAAHRAVIHRTRSFAAAVAGPAVKTRWNFTPVTKLDEEDINELNEAGVNAIQSNSGVPFLNNWSSLSKDPALYDLNVTDALNNLTAMIRDAMGELIWRPNEGRDGLRAEARAIVDGVMTPLVEGGYLFPTRDADGNFADNGYVVDVEDLRTSGQVSPYDSMTVTVGIKLSPTLRHIHVPIRKVDLRQVL